MKAMCIDENKDFVRQAVPDLVSHGEFDVKRMLFLNAVKIAERSC